MINVIETAIKGDRKYDRRCSSKTRKRLKLDIKATRG